ncbi:DUF4390 domain-containing protein [Marinicella rhabdoformis]|uniref:DUF4390 domain-containing protein n=1 Tax=Marinicella rhabdoformis TaxID=2580566 RepID=UPI0012AEDF7E|nr:DUF4390 domain-containing protein [Marinicella rhabdoformis]
MRFIGFIFCLILSTHSQAGDIQVQSIETQWGALQLTVNPHYNITASEVINEAINSGIVLSLIAKLHSRQSRDYWFDNTISKHQQTFEVRYFSLSGQYQLHNTDNDERNSFVSLADLWRHIERRTEFKLPLNLAQETDYFSTRLRLDAGALPSAMQLPVLLSNDWRFKSDWFESPLDKPKSAQRP